MKSSGLSVVTEGGESNPSVDCRAGLYTAVLSSAFLYRVMFCSDMAYSAVLCSDMA